VKTKKAERLSALFDLLAAAPDVLYVNDIADKLGVTISYTNQLIRELRLMFGDDDTVNLVCEPKGHQHRWGYRLEGTLEGITFWEANRIGDAESRLVTMNAVLSSIVRNIDADSVDGKKARIMQRYIRRALEDLAELRSA